MFIRVTVAIFVVSHLLFTGLVCLDLSIISFSGSCFSFLFFRLIYILYNRSIQIGSGGFFFLLAKERNY